MKATREIVKEQFKKYIPEEFVAYVVDLLFEHKTIFKVSKPRKTKLGDYRFLREKNAHKITVNSDLNPYSFLITTLHEFAHLKTFVAYKNTVSPHGVEWKEAFKELLIPVLEHPTFPEDIKKVLKRTLNNLKASSCTDINLYRVLKAYDSKTDKSLLEEIENNSLFQLNTKSYRRGRLRRSRYECMEIQSGKLYLVHRLAEVDVLSEN